MPMFFPSRLLLAASALALVLPAWAQQKVVGDFTRSRPDSGWVLSGSATLTAPAIDADGLGWLRLTGNANQQLGRALQDSGGISANDGLSISFSYISWGGGSPGADGISVFLYDARHTMDGAMSGGGLGFCKGNGGWLALALDEYGNFSHPQDGCAGGGGPGNRPQTLTLRGPASAGNPFVAQASTGGALDSPGSAIRGVATDVAIHLQPRATGGFLVTVEWRPLGAPAWKTLIDKAEFPFPAPPNVRVGVAASTGAARNIHEVRHLVLVTQVPIVLTQRFEPAIIRPAGVSTLTLGFGNAGGRAATLERTLTLQLPEGMAVAAAPALGGTCAGGLSAQPGGRTISMERGALLRAAGCTVTVNVTAAAEGSLTFTVPAGAVMTGSGINVSPASATLTVRR